MSIQGVSIRRGMLGLLIVVASFLILGTITALWPNPFFVRMTPAGGWEVSLLALQSILLGLYFAIRRPVCSAKVTTFGSVLNFLGVACPVCNKILLFLFGWDALMTYYEPIRIYVAAIGAALGAFAVLYEWFRRQQPPASLVA